MNLNCVHSAEISWCPASDRVTTPFSFSLSPSCVVTVRLVIIYRCRDSALTH